MDKKSLDLKEITLLISKLYHLEKEIESLEDVKGIKIQSGYTPLYLLSDEAKEEIKLTVFNNLTKQKEEIINTLKNCKIESFSNDWKENLEINLIGKYL